MKTIKPLLTFIILLVINSNINAQKDSVLFHQSIDFYNNDKPKKALSLINDAIKINDKNANYQILKGKILYEINKDIGEFFSYLTKGVETEPTSPKPLITRAYYYEQIAKVQDAILDYNDALKLAKEDSVFVQIYINRGGLHTKVQRPDLGYEDLMKAYQLDSTNIGMLNNLAICLDDLGKRKESFEILLKIVEINPDFPPGWVNLGYQASLRENYDDALMYLNKADSLSPNQPFALNNRGYAKYKLKDYKGALKDINRSLEIDPSNSYAYRNKALIYIDKKELDTACENLHLAQKKGFSLYYGEEVNELIKKHCIK